MRPLLLAAALTLAIPAFAQTPAPAGQASPATQAAAGAFVIALSNETFAVLRDKSLSKDAARAKFRNLLRANFAIPDIGNRLIRRYRAQITPAQLSAYQAALPVFIVNTYADRLYDFADARVTLVRTAPRGSRGDVDVFTRITRPNAGNPIEAVWAVRPGNPSQITNLTVNGVNVALTQEADFSAYIQKNGFDALVDFMKKAK
ncbi:MlaC/ttg2D family ABC transporter substrate-binding protein [Sandaracinobacteroides saxicola]|uniref:ABC transporter substrate-binding protein n=1 Tax=Sandaracinobacteroides saxicola TaxID=2759707 RepID=A0A7G5IL39_9SPHN|nr:ABC transporter substrate-binding protein [Sandaracinobacteroides saxicola]QMW24081.1 ABC transporter substrate-binding protein [Sandaracinobacteroides saxicola]